MTFEEAGGVAQGVGNSGVQAPVLQKKEIKGIHTESEKMKLFLFADGMIIYIENLKNTNPLN
jgi:hypothetical protein